MNQSIRSRGCRNGIASSISANRKYRDRLDSLAEMQGSDNSPLLGLCNLGVRAGLSDEQIISDIRHANGTSPWSDSAIKRALETARASGRQPSVKSDRTRTRRMAWRPSQKQETSPLGRNAETFVRRRITKGQDATFESLIESSPIPIPSDTREQARIFLQTLYNSQECVFIGNTTDAGVIDVTIKTVNVWMQPTDSARLRTLPLLMANPLTGGLGKKKDGQPSYRCGECVAAFRFALVEFDGMPLSEQCAFWAGVIKSPNMFPLCTLVYSGGKSIHGLIEIDAKDWKDWDAQIQLLQSAVCNLNAPKAFQADRVCKNVDRLTRLAGAYRADKGKVQSLLWLSSRNMRLQFTTVPPPPSPVPHGGIADGLMRCPIPPPRNQKTYLLCPPPPKLFWGNMPHPQACSPTHDTARSS